MKKLAVLFLTVLITVGLTACNQVPPEVIDCLENPDAPECQVCEDGFHLEGTECVPDELVCETGYHEENGECVEDTVTCEAGYHEENGQCVEDPFTCETGYHEENGECVLDPTTEEIAADAIVTGYEATGSMAFLGAAVASMDFSQAMTLTTELDFEIEEDSTETHYIEATITDHFIFDELGDKIKRDIYLDVDGEMVIEFSMILVEVETGVHVYIQPEMIINGIADGNQEVLDVLGWVGFDSEWALFQFDDSLESVLSIEVLKDMIVSLFFSEMGEMFFYELQEELEGVIGFDLNQYGVEFGQFIDYLIEEDFDNAEIILQGIDTDGIILHFDHMYVAWRLYDHFMMYEADLNTAGFDTTKLQLLNTATYDVGLDEMVVNLPIDPLDGTEAFFLALTPTEEDSLIEIVIKPTIEEMVYNGLVDQVNPDWLQNDFEQIMNGNEAFFLEHWPSYDHTAEMLEVTTLGAYLYWQQLTEEERGLIHWAIDHQNHGWIVWELQRFEEENDGWHNEWMYKRHREEYEPMEIKNMVLNFINFYSADIMTNYSIDTAGWLAEIENKGLFFWWHEIDQVDRDAFMFYFEQEGNEMYHDAVYSMMHIAMNPWNYEEVYENHDGWIIHPMWLQHDLIMLIQSHQTALTNDFGYDVPALIAEIEMYGVMDWYMMYTSDFDRETIEEIAEWNDYEYYWVFEQLDEFYHSDYDEWYIWWGRSEEYYYMDDMNMYLENMLSDYRPALETVLFDVDGNLAEIQSMGAVEWFMNHATEDERNALRNVLDEFSMNEYHHVMWFLEEHVNNPGQFGWCFGNWGHCIDDEWATQAMETLINQHTDWLLNEYGVTAQDWLDEIDMYGAINWFMFETDEFQREVLMDLAESSEWPYEVMWKLDDIMYQEEDLLAWLTEHQTELDALGFNTTQEILDLETVGIQVYLSDYVTEADLEILLEEYVYPRLEALRTAIETQEVAEFLIDQIFNNPHMTYFLGMQEVIDNPIFDETIIAANLTGVDFDALVLETVDLELLLEAIYNGETAYTTFITGLETTAPNSALILEVLTPGVASVQPYMMYVDDIQYAFDGLVVFEDYISPEYWMDNMADVAVVKTEDFEILTTLELDGLALAGVFDDLTVDLNTYLMGFETLPFPYDSDWQCLDPLDDDCDEPEFGNVIAGLSQLGSAYLHILYDPTNQTWMEVTIDVTDALDSVVDLSYQDHLDQNPGYTPNENDDIWTGVNNATLSITMEEGADIVLPAEADVDDVNAIAQDAAKFAVTMFARDIFRDMIWHYEDSMTLPTQVTTYTLTELEEMFNIEISAAFDPEMSTLTVGLPIDPLDLNSIPFELTLYWVDGTEVFDAPLTFATLIPLFDMDNNLADAAAWQTMIDLVDDENFHMTKMWLMLMLEDNNDDYYEDEHMPEN